MQRVFVDANVLYSRTTRDWLFMLRNEAVGMFQLHCTEDVLVEVLNSYRDNNPEASGGTISRLRKHLVDCLDEVLDDFDATIPYSGRDPHDRHVHAAAVAAHADILLTADAGLLEMETSALSYSVYHPDDFFVLVDDSAAPAAGRVTQQQMRYWRSQPAAKRLSDALRDSGCPQFADRVDAHLRELSGTQS